LIELLPNLVRLKTLTDFQSTMKSRPTNHHNPAHTNTLKNTKKSTAQNHKNQPAQSKLIDLTSRLLQLQPADQTASKVPTSRFESLGQPVTEPDIALFLSVIDDLKQQFEKVDADEKRQLLPTQNGRSFCFTIAGHRFAFRGLADDFSKMNLTWSGPDQSKQVEFFDLLTRLKDCGVSQVYHNQRLSSVEHQV